MAILKDSLVQGSMRVTDTLYSNNINISDIITAKGLVITSEAAEEHIKFSRTSINYILFPDNTNAGIAIGYATGTAYCPLIIQKSSVFPGGTTETINFGLSSNRWKTIYGKSGDFTGTVTISKSQDASGTANNSPALIVGGTATSAHLELDGNEIMAKATDTTVGPLYLNNDGGTVQIGKGGLIVGNATAGAEVDVKAVSNAGEIYFWSANSTTGNRGIWLKNAGATTSSTLFTVNQSNQISAMATIACTPEINYTKAAGDASALLKLTNTSTTGSPFIGVDFLVPSFVSGEIKHIFGKSHSTNNSAYISYNHSADGSGNNAIAFGLYNVGLARLSVNSGLTVNGQITSKPISEDYEGGKLNLSPNSAVVGGECGIALQEKNSRLEIFGIPDDLLHSDTGTSLVIDPYAKTITGGYTITGTLSGNASNVNGTVTVAHGGTGATTFTSDCVIVGNGTNALSSRGLKVTGATTDNVILTCASADKTLKLTSTSTLYLNSKTGTSIVFQQNDSEVARFNINGNLALGVKTDNAAIGTQNTHKLYVSGDSCFNGKIAFGKQSSNVITENASIAYNSTSKTIDSKFPWNKVISGSGTEGITYNATGPVNGVPALWKFNCGIATPTNGDTITIEIPVAGHDSGVFVSTDNGTTYRPVSVWGTSRLTTHYPVGHFITLTFDANGTTNSLYPIAGGTTRYNSNTTQIPGVGCWRVVNYYDSGAPYGIRVYNQTSGYNGDYPLLVSRTALSTQIGTKNSNSSYSNNVYAVIWDSPNDGTHNKTPTLNPSSGLIKVYDLSVLGSKTKNYVLIAPSTANGAPTWRALVAADLPTVPYTKGGTGLTTLGSAGQVLKVNSSANGIEWGTVSTADEKVKVAANITTAADYPVVFANSNKSTTAAETAGLNKSGTKFYFNPSTGLLTATQVANAIWNDYAEYRKQLYTIQPGYVIKDTNSGYIVKANERLIPGAQIVSDTWGHSMGKTDECQTPVAVAGRVLAYTYRPREQYHAGMAVCSAPGGTIDIMTREEIRDYPDAIIGIVSEIPDYEEWGSGKVKVDGRIWIKVR